MFLPCGNGWTANNSGPPADCDVLLDMTGSFFVPKTTSQSEFMESCKQKSSPEMKKAPQFSQSKNGYNKADRRRIPSPTWIE